MRQSKLNPLTGCSLYALPLHGFFNGWMPAMRGGRAPVQERGSE
jgi:hypothetical protein